MKTTINNMFIDLDASGTVDFGVYDLWTTTAKYVHSNSPADNNVDLVIVVTRNVALDLTQADRMSLNNLGWDMQSNVGLATNESYLLNLPVSGKNIVFGTMATSGRTLYIRDGVIQNTLTRSTGAREFFFRGFIHELGHLLTYGGHYQSGNWSMIANSDDRSYAPTSMEMHQLGWIDMEIIRQSSSTNSIFTLRDLYSTGDAIAIEVDDEHDLYYYLENHQFLSDFDFVASIEFDKSSRMQYRADYGGVYSVFVGNYIGHQNPYLLRKYVQSATGSYAWSSETTTLLDGNVAVPLIVKGEPDSDFGETRSELVKLATSPLGKTYHPVYVEDLAGISTQTKAFLGGQPGDQHRDCDGTELYTPTTNPSTNHELSGLYTTSPGTLYTSNIGVRVVTQSGGIYYLKIASNNQDVTPPSRVTSTTVPSSSIPNPGLVWNAPTVKVINIAWAGSIPEADFDHFLITGGDADVTASPTETNANIVVTVPANESYVARVIEVFTVDVAGNRSCVNLDGPKECIVVSEAPNAQKISSSSFAGDVDVRNGSTPQFEAFPNPTSNQLTVIVHDVLDRPTIQVVNIDGTINTPDYTVSTGLYKTEITIDATMMSNGYHQLAIRHTRGVLPLTIVKH